MIGCTYCGEPDHSYEECPARQARARELKEEDESHLTRDDTQQRVESRDRTTIHNLQ